MYPFVKLALLGPMKKCIIQSLSPLPFLSNNDQQVMSQTAAFEKKPQSAESVQN